jgi:hypothetical protein
MALNPFFLQGSTGEQFLIQDLINEQLKIYGIEVYYLPRKIFKTDDIIREIQSSKFDDVFLIEAYLNNYDGYAPGSDLMTKFGLKLQNEISLTISRERYEEFIAPFLEGISSGIREGQITEYDFADLITRPKEGDLIYFPLGERLFEIKRVESEKPFYQLGRNYVYELSCELYEYENELIDTAIEEVDNTVEDEGYITTLRIVGTAITATASVAGISTSTPSIGSIVLTEDGYGYTSVPTVTISSPTSGTTATAVAITTSVGNVQSVKEIRLTNAGSGYTSNPPPTVTISGGGGSGAAATAIVVSRGVLSFSITNAGRGYYGTVPTVTVAGPSVGQTATAKAIISDGELDSIQIINAGYGYTQIPTVTISSPVSGVGTFIYNEEIVGQSSGVTARVRNFKRRTDINVGLPPIDLQVALNTGNFSVGETIVGGISSATYVIESYNRESYDNPYDVNEEIETEADGILDFTESNPFGDY